MILTRVWLLTVVMAGDQEAHRQTTVHATKASATEWLAAWVKQQAVSESDPDTIEEYFDTCRDSYDLDEVPVLGAAS